jgi:hypothetical protein
MRARVRPEEIIGEWGIRDVTPPSQRERRLLEDERDLNPLTGRPLRRRLRNFRAEPDSYLASLGGPLPYMRRLREIDAAVERHEAALAAVYPEHRNDPDGWRRIAERWDFDDVNELIEKHNHWYPAEARLPMNPRTRDYVEVGGRPYRRPLLDAAWVLDRYPVPTP